jgi:transposase
MSCTANQSGPIQIISPCELRTMFVSFELSKRKWLLTLLSPGSDKMSKYTVAGGDWNTLIALLMQAKEKAEVRIRQPVRIIAIHEAGLDGFSVHRMLEKNGVESHVVDAASVAVPRRKRRAKSDRIDGETLMRTLMA